MKSVCAVIIATRNRYESLGQVLTALTEQSLKPQWVVIADSSEGSFKDEVRSICADANFNSLNIHFLDANFHSLTRQKNHAVEWLMANWEGDYIQILDDDTVPPSEYLAELSQFLDCNESFIGVSGITHDPTDSRTPRSLKFELARIFGLESTKSGSITRGGIGTFTTDGHQVSAPVQWLHGCSMWRATVFERIRYLDRLEGSALCEDLEFSIRASRLGELAVLNQSRLKHEMSLIGRPDDFLHYYRFARNRAFVFHSWRQSRRLPMFYFVPNIALIFRSILHMCSPGRLGSGLQQLKGLVSGTWAAVNDGEVL